MYLELLSRTVCYIYLFPFFKIYLALGSCDNKLLNHIVNYYDKALNIQKMIRTGKKITATPCQNANIVLIPRIAQLTT